MNKILFLVVCVGAFIASCNVVDEPYGPNGGVDPGDEQFNDTVYSDSTVNRRRIMLEEFTGHKCPNCPEGADIAEDIYTTYPDDFLSVAIHNSGAFSKPDLSDPTHLYPSEFETQTGENLRIKYQFSSFPSGMLNRSEINGSVKVPYQTWEAEVIALINNAAYMVPRFKLQLENIYNSKAGERSIRVRYKATCLQNITGTVAIASYVLESKIIAPQTDKRLSDSYVPDYEHNHVLRVGFPNDGSGKTLFTNPTPGEIAEVISPSDEISVGINDDWIPENMNVVVFLFEPVSGEILHVEEVHLTSL